MCNSLALLTLTSLSLSSSCRRRSSISASISLLDMLSDISDIFFSPNVDVRGLEMPLKFNDCSFKCLFASLTRMIIRSLSRIFCAYFLFRSCALEIYLCFKTEFQIRNGFFEGLHRNRFATISTCFILCFRALVSSLCACNNTGSSP